ncbi:MAG TPA: tetratricopeptide repeat protein [Terriglobales bacterium]|nr:tetratricopeptide repeat protein [Terriglobales bacterium]
MDSTEHRPGQHPVGSSVFQSPQKRRLILCLLLVLATIALYNPVTRDPFLNFDDVVYVTDNPQVRAGLTWNTVVWAFHTSEAANWHPITWLSHALDCQIFGLNPEGPHTVNVLLHAASAVLLFLILQSATGLAWRSLAVAALFALHPINVESVAWIAERKNVLSMLFFLLALAAYGWYTRRASVGRYLVVTAVYALGLMTKPQVITFPFALLLLDYWPLCRLDRLSFGKLIGEKAPWIAMSAASAVITMKVQAGATQVKLSPWIHLGNAAISYVKYLEKAFWPVNLAPVYPHPELAISLAAAALSGFVIVALTTLAVIFRQRRPFFVGWFWFLGTMVPMIGLVQVGVQAMADRYAYIPLLGIFVILCWGAAELINTWHVPAAVSAVGAAAILLTLGLALHRQVSLWSDNVTLWTHTLAITEGNYIAEDGLATALVAQGRMEEALPHLQRARFLRPDDPMATLNIASYEQIHGNYQAALDGFARVPRFTKIPYLVAMARVNSGYAHCSLKEYDRAKQDFEATLNEQPGNSMAYRGLGLVAQRVGDVTEAAKDYKRSVELQPTPLGYLLLAQALEIGGQTEAAGSARSQAARMTPDLTGDVATVKQLLAN